MDSRYTFELRSIQDVIVFLQHSYCSSSSLTSLLTLVLVQCLGAFWLLRFKMFSTIYSTFLVLGVSLLARAQLCPPNTACNGTSFPALINVTLDDLTTGLAQGLFTSVDLVNAYTDRIREVNGSLSMVTEINPDAIAIAQELDQDRAAGTLKGPLHGIPVLIKNNIATDDQMNNTAGSFSLLGAKVPRDSTIAAKLRQAGAIILGKSVRGRLVGLRTCCC